MGPKPPRDPPEPPPERDEFAFHLGRLLITRGALDALTQQEVIDALARHVGCDWGDVASEDWAENDLSLREGFRLLSAYHTESGVKFWIITEADRSATTVLLPAEY